ncbi:MAG: stage II sporulation protein M [Candidatus Aminicenantes bacterium]|nr:stage II sporulation protein M [Candidatus Aminicenantes bacterium]
MNLIRKPIEIIRENKKVYIIVNAVFYGLILLGMVITSFFPELQVNALAGAEKDLSSGWLSTAGSAYSSGNLLAAMGLTFFINFSIGTFLTMTIPSFVIPFSGLLMGIYRAFFWGILFSPISPDMRAPMIPHYLTILIEGQAYVVAMFAIYLHGKSFLFPKSIGIKSRWNGYKHGLVQSAWMYVPLTILLLVAAVYEAFDVILLVPLFK